MKVFDIPSEEKTIVALVPATMAVRVQVVGAVGKPSVFVDAENAWPPAFRVSKGI